MPYTFEFVEGGVRRWTLTDDGATADVDGSYRPAVYVSAADEATLGSVRGFVRDLPTVETVSVERKRTGWRRDPEAVLRATVRDAGSVRDVAATVRGWGAPGEYRPFDVDLSPGFRYCLDTGTDPVPSRPLGTLRVAVPERGLGAGPGERVTATVGDREIRGEAAEVAEGIAARVAETDPDALVLNTAEVIPWAFEVARDSDLALGRRRGYRKLAGRSTYTSYGRVGHSPARYAVPGRALVDESNTFLWDEAGLAGCLDLVGRSWKPLSELAWASIGNVLTAIQVREARERGVLVPWRSWRHEFFKTARQARAADRGGVTLAPEVGVHEGVHEVDFASLYPAIIVSRNLSPETVRCDCCDGDDVPGLGYSVCEARGYLPDVLEPLVEDRADLKAALRDATDPGERERLEGRVDALKWILVSCFGYQGFSNAKFGRIECHEAINAHAREVLLDAKDALEGDGWRVRHGIVDSLWVESAAPGTGTREDDERSALGDCLDRVSTAADVPLEHEATYDWVAFVPLRGSEAGALTKYFGKRRDGQYRYRGVACRRRSTPPFVAEAQRDLVAAFDEHREPAAVVERLERHLRRLRTGDVPAAELVVRERASKRAGAYERDTRVVAALERAGTRGLDCHPGQSVSYVVTDDDRTGRERVALPGEAEGYDAGFYADLLMRAAAEVTAPLGWRERDVRRHLADRTDASLAAYT
ncbi:MAG: type B DNA-directed DNA polymerase [Haloarculaceae archaeon]